jgi:ATP-dependent DNA helicase RecQ
MSISTEFSSAVINAFEANKRLADRAVEQVPDDKLHVALDMNTCRAARKRGRADSLVSDVLDLGRRLHDRFLERERREVARVAEVLELVCHDGCQVAALCGHFGEALSHRCGHCTWCLRGRPHELSGPRWPYIPAEVLDQSLALAAQRPEILADPSAVARLLCGPTSPKLTPARLSRHPLFGELAGVPFPWFLRDQ